MLVLAGMQKLKRKNDEKHINSMVQYVVLQVAIFSSDISGVVFSWKENHKHSFLYKLYFVLTRIAEQPWATACSPRQ